MKSKFETYFGVRVPKFGTFAVELFRCKGAKHQRHDQFRESTASYDFLQKYTLSMDKLQYLRPSAAGLYYYPPGRACKPNSSGDYEKRKKEINWTEKVPRPGIEPGVLPIQSRYADHFTMETDAEKWFQLHV